MMSMIPSSLQDVMRIVKEAKLSSEIEFSDAIAESVHKSAEDICKTNVHSHSGYDQNLTARLDNILTSRLIGYPIMILLLAVVFWITLLGANWPSSILFRILFSVENHLINFLKYLKAPEWFVGMTVFGAYRSLAWVVSVMLPPIAIFFPCFTLLEDLGYLPRIAFNLDTLFKRVGSHGKQALTMCMGFGCNAAGVVSCRIIDSPRERLIACLTNTFVPCNGRFPAIILVSTMFLRTNVISARGLGTTTIWLLFSVFLGVTVTLIVSWALSRTVLKGVPSAFAIELPPYRQPQIAKTLIRSFLDRTVFVLARAAAVAAPAGIVTWVLANTSFQGASLLLRLAKILSPLGNAIGLDGFILAAFLLGLPANEIVLPILIMGYSSGGVIVDIESLSAFRSLLVSCGWTSRTALCFIIFSVLHYPCATTLWTIWHETRDFKWTLFGAFMPFVIASGACFLVAQVSLLSGIT
ncbi:MAG TPA: nucleoside recognition domain-containing protein [Bacillota bacterium]|nr:nucleoside recognition domain-containing protein [Bacillota bacterium]